MFNKKQHGKGIIVIEIIIDSELRKIYCRSLIDELKEDGSDTVEFKKTGVSPTARQRRLWFLWCREVSVSGLGQDDTVDTVHIRAKWMFVKPIMLAQSEMFALIYNHFMKTVEHSEIKSKQCIEFARDYISTEALTKDNRIKSLKDFQRYWVGKGVNLTDPSLQGVDLSCKENK